MFLACCCLIPISELLAYEMKNITTEVGHYVIHEFKELPPGLVEVTNDGKHFVLDDGHSLFCYELTNLQAPIGRVDIPRTGTWKLHEGQVMLGTRVDGSSLN